MTLRLHILYKLLLYSDTVHCIYNTVSRILYRLSNNRCTVNKISPSPSSLFFLIEPHTINSTSSRLSARAARAWPGLRERPPPQGRESEGYSYKYHRQSSGDISRTMNASENGTVTYYSQSQLQYELVYVASTFLITKLITLIVGRHRRRLLRHDFSYIYIFSLLQLFHFFWQFCCLTWQVSLSFVWKFYLFTELSYNKNFSPLWCANERHFSCSYWIDCFICLTSRIVYLI